MSPVAGHYSQVRTADGWDVMRGVKVVSNPCRPTAVLSGPKLRDHVPNGEGRRFEMLEVLG